MQELKIKIHERRYVVSMKWKKTYLNLELDHVEFFSD